MKILLKPDIYLYFFSSLLVLDTIKAAVKEKDNISLVIVDSPMPATGLIMLNDLKHLDIKIYYRNINDLHHILQMVSTTG